MVGLPMFNFLAKSSELALLRSSRLGLSLFLTPKHALPVDVHIAASLMSIMSKRALKCAPKTRKEG